MFTQPDRLDIKLPSHWNRCTASQLETIARVIREETERVTPFHPFSMTDVKTALFFVLGNVTIVEPINPRVPVEDQYYVCSHPDIKGPFHLYLWQIDYWVNGQLDYEKIAEMNISADVEGNGNPVSGSTSAAYKRSSSPVNKDGSATAAPLPKKVKGQLDWLDDPSDIGLTNMPYDILKLRKHSDTGNPLLPITYYLLPKKAFQAPSALMQNFSWQQYRFAQDYMDNYIQMSNYLIKMNQHRTRFSPADFIAQEQRVDLARALFLATIFDAKVKYIDTDTQKAVFGFHYTSNQHTDNAQYFRHFPEDKWQVILFWWSGMMRYLQKQFPHVFKQSKVKGSTSARNNPLEVYTATIATLEKYLKQTEEELNRKTFILTLETLERMAKENEELEKIRSKNK